VKPQLKTLPPGRSLRRRSLKEARPHALQVFVVKHYQPHLYEYPKFDATFRRMLADAEAAADAARRPTAQAKPGPAGADKKGRRVSHAAADQIGTPWRRPGRHRGLLSGRGEHTVRCANDGFRPRARLNPKPCDVHYQTTHWVAQSAHVSAKIPMKLWI